MDLKQLRVKRGIFIKSESIQNLSQRLDNALLRSKPIAPLGQGLEDFTLSQGYEIQSAGLKARLIRGETQIGYKMGFTSRAKMEQMGLHSPINGYLTNKMQLQEDETFLIKNHIHPKIEPEVVFILSKNLRGKISVEEALDACSAVTVGLEILDSRFTGFKYFSLPDVVADNCSASEFLVSSTLFSPKDLDLKNLKITLEVDGKEVDGALSSAIMENPLESLVALAAMAEDRHFELKAGSIVLAGAVTAAIPLVAGMKVTAKMDQKAEVSLRSVCG